MTHAGIAATRAAFSRRKTTMGWRGRKRKAGRRHPSGQLAREAQPDDRLRTARQPHRRPLRQEDRMSEKAESPIGRLLLRGLLRRDGEQDDENASGRYEAGALYAQVVGAYRSVIEAPKSVSGSGVGFDCGATADKRNPCTRDPCVCAYRKERYDGAFEALDKVGQRCARAVSRVAIHREELTPQESVYLLAGLDALAVHFGLTRRRGR